MKKIIYALVFLWVNIVVSQVKVGDNINTIDAASILELESVSKVFVVSRVTTLQMNAIIPLNGALVYNTDDDCIFQFNNGSWSSLCVNVAAGETVTAIIDNNDGTFSYTNEMGANVIISKASLSNNGDGTYTFTNGSLTNLIIDTNASAIPFNNSTSGLIATNVQDAIDELQNTILTDDDITGVSFDGTDLTVDEGATTFSADLSALEESADIEALQADVDQNETDADTAIAANVAAIAAHNTADGDLDATNELSDLDLTGNILTLTNAEAGATGVDLSGFVSTDDQNLESATLSGTSELAINIESGTDVTVDLSALEESADIAAVQADVDQNETDADAGIAANAAAITAHNTADGDLDATNELSDLDLTGNILTLTNPEAGATGVNLSGFVSTDDQNLESATLSGTSELAINIESGNDVTVDLSALEESADIAAVQADVDQNETDSDAADAAIQTDVDQNETDADAGIAANAAAITAHNTADGDLDATNELSDLDLTGNILTLTNAEAGATGVDLSGFVSTDDQNLESATLSGTSELAINIESGNDVTVDLSALEESADIAAVQADVDQNETDADAAVALKEDTANKSTDITLADGTNTKFPTELAVKTYVDAQINTLSTLADGTIYIGDATNTAQEVAVSGDAVLDNTGVLTINDDAVTASKINPDVAGTGLSQNAVTGALEVDALTITDVIAGNKIATILEADGTLVEIDETITSLESVVGTESTIRYTDETGNSNDIPNIVRSVNGVNPAANGNVAVILSSVTTGLESNRPVTAIDSDIYIVSGEVAPNADRNGVAFIYDDITGWQEVTTDLSTNDARYVNVNGDTMIGPLALGGFNITDLNDPTNAQDAATKNYVDTGLGLKEDAANKSTDGTLAGNSDINFPTEQAVKTYVDGQIAATIDDDITGVSFDGTDLTVDEGATTFSANLSALEESADIAALQADVDQNETDADTAIAANAAAIAAHNTADGDLDATNELSDLDLTGNILTLTNAEAGATGVDLSGFVSTDDQNLESATLSGTSELAINIESGTDVTVDLSALEESADIAAVQADVDQNETDADAGIAANAAAITAHNTADGDLDATNELSDLDLTGNILTLTNAEAGATGVNLSGFVSTDDQNLESATLSGTSELAINIESGTDVTVDLSALEESADIAAVQADVDQNETDSDAADAAIQADVDQNETDADAAIAANAAAIAAHNTADGDLDATNEIQTLSISGNDLSISGAGGNTVTLPSFTETVTALSQNTSTGLITYTNESALSQTANVVAAETTNEITVGANGGAYYESPIKAFGKISSAGAVTKATSGVSVTKLTGNGHYRITLPAGVTSDANYIIQLTQPGRGGAGNDDPGISYNNQTTTTFEVIIGDNDNGGTDRSRFDSEFMFTVIDL